MHHLQFTSLFAFRRYRIIVLRDSKTRLFYVLSDKDVCVCCCIYYMDTHVAGYNLYILDLFSSTLYQ